MLANAANLSGKRIAIWGLAFKPYTDDIREAPALYIIKELLKAGAEIAAFDPEASENVKSLMGDKIYYASDEYEALEGADALIIATEWPVFRTPDFSKMANIMNKKLILDGRNLYDVHEMEQLEFTYISIGRKTVIKL